MQVWSGQPDQAFFRLKLNRMLILTVSSECGSIVVTSDVSDYGAGNIATIDVTTKTNCCTTETTYQITDFVTPDSLLVDNGPVREIHLLPTWFSTTDAINDGVYQVTIKTTLDDTSFVEETACVLIDCNVKCSILDLIEAGDYETHRIYESIQMAIDCTGADCDCTVACNLFKLLIAKLNLNSTTYETIDDCGCS